MNKILILSIIFALAALGISILYLNMPPMTQNSRRLLFRFPQKPNDLVQALGVIQNYKQKNFWYVIFAFVYFYMFLQSFAIPGAAFLSMISGPLFGAIPGFIISQLSATLGSVTCFTLSKSLGQAIVQKVFSNPLKNLRQRIQKHKHNLFWYMLFLRVTPLVPNWFVNVATPLVGIPLKYFFIATLFGLAPNNIILVRTGLTLKDIQQFGFKLQNFLTLLILAFLSLIPTLFKGKLQQIDKKIK